MILVLNFKTYFKKVADYIELINNLKKIKSKVKFWLAFNPYFYFSLVPRFKKQFKIGLQNLAPLSEKPQTGETIYEFERIKNYLDFVMIGHSERYRLGENPELLRKKVETLQDKKLNLLIFFSENSYEPKENFSEVKEKTEKNLRDLLSVIKKENARKIYLVYEPWWAISTEGGKFPSYQFLSDFLFWYRKNYDFPILYGGSYNSNLAKIYRGLKFNGYVLGKASTDINELRAIIEYYS